MDFDHPFVTAHPGERQVFPDRNKIEREQKVQREVQDLLESLPIAYRAGVNRRLQRIVNLSK